MLYSREHQRDTRYRNQLKSLSGAAATPLDGDDSNGAERVKMMAGRHARSIPFLLLPDQRCIHPPARDVLFLPGFRVVPGDVGGRAAREVVAVPRCRVHKASRPEIWNAARSLRRDLPMETSMLIAAAQIAHGPFALVTLGAAFLCLAGRLLKPGVAPREQLRRKASQLNTAWPLRWYAHRDW